MQTEQSIRVLVMHEDPLVTIGLVAALREQRDIEVMAVGAESDVASCQVLIADHASAISWLANRREAGHSSKAPCAVVVLTALDRERDVRAALEVGVSGYLLLGCRTEDLVHCVRTVARGAPHLCPRVSQRLVESVTHEALTHREADVLKLVVRGHCNKTIARELDIAVGTVKTHVKAILGKLDARTRTHAAAVASERGLVT